MSARALAWVVASLLLAGPAVAGNEPGHEQRHSGVIVAVAPDAGTITVEEMGPWAGPSATPVRWTIRLTPETRIELVVRAEEPATAGGWRGDFTAVPLAPRELRPGDFVTVTGVAGGRAASSVSVVRPEPPPHARLPRDHQ